MDPQQQAFLEILQRSVSVIETARAEQGWTAGAVALVLILCILGLGWMVRRLCNQVDEFATWRQQVLQGQVENTVRALELSTQGLDEFGNRFTENTTALRQNTEAVHSLRDAIRNAPCGKGVI